MERGRTPYTNKSHTVRAFEVFQSLRKDDVLCDVKLKTDDGTVIRAHRVVLASASPYFRAMFTSCFEETNKECVDIRELDPNALRLLVDYIYTAQIKITEVNVQDLLCAAHLLQLFDVQDACCYVLQYQLHPSNGLGIKMLADIYDCLQLWLFSDSFIRHHFSEVLESDEFLSLSSEQVVELISSDELTVPFEEKIFESVICWVNHNFIHREDILPKLMEHVRLPLVSCEYLMKRVQDEPLLKNKLECKDYIIEALNCHLFKSEQQPSLIPKTIRTKPRKPVGIPKVILVVGGHNTQGLSSVEYYDPATYQWQCGPAMSMQRFSVGLAVLKNQCVFAVGGINRYNEHVSNVDVLDMSSPSPCWVPTVAMSLSRAHLGVTVLNNCIYAVGGQIDHDGGGRMSAEVFDFSTQKWKFICDMSTIRIKLGVGSLNDILYAVGGKDHDNQTLKSVESYNPTTNTWSPEADMRVGRYNVGVGVLDGVLYAVGGKDGVNVFNSVEAYSPNAGVWTSVSDMHLCRASAGVVALEGLLYVVGGFSNDSIVLASVEIYYPKTNIWSLLSASMEIERFWAGVAVIDKPPQINS